MGHADNNTPPPSPALLPSSPLIPLYYYPPPKCTGQGHDRGIGNAWTCGCMASSSAAAVPFAFRSLVWELAPSNGHGDDLIKRDSFIEMMMIRVTLWWSLSWRGIDGSPVRARVYVWVSVCPCVFECMYIWVCVFISTRMYLCVYICLYMHLSI